MQQGYSHALIAQWRLKYISKSISVSLKNKKNVEYFINDFETLKETSYGDMYAFFVSYKVSFCSF